MQLLAIIIDYLKKFKGHVISLAVLLLIVLVLSTSAIALADEQKFDIKSSQSVFSKSFLDYYLARGISWDIPEQNLSISFPSKSYNGDLISSIVIFDPTKTDIWPTLPINNFGSVYKVDLYPEEEIILSKPATIALPDVGTTNKKHNIYVWQKGDLIWTKLESITDFKNKKVKADFAKFPSYFVVADDNLVWEGIASWYRCKGGLYAASTIYPRGTKLKVTNIKTGKWVIIKVNDYGPDPRIHPDRVIDLDSVAFKTIGKISTGTMAVRVEKYDPPVGMKNKAK